MKPAQTALCAAVCWLLTSAPVTGQVVQAQLRQPGVPQAAASGLVSAVIQFRVVSASDFRALQDARVVLMDRNGRLVKTGLTDSEGIWRANITVPRDPRFRDVGTLTALVVASGHNETVVFEVPVRKGTVQPVTLQPIQPGLRNEPYYTLGQIHRLDVIDLVNRIASQLGLERQPPIPGESGYAPWGPAIRPHPGPLPQTGSTEPRPSQQPEGQ
ncbi:hypothetical protein GCM10010885_22850 [Alicyclobacillus cellulosilyticus]|uniref:Carboxypeptidase family protein n=1 Tax=Alicyclobacillus cellulosilyticus TaxID=1003997 RepID=A0A917KK46_9BACL|nr:hypothetical protein [Alicyclobacillus cellulosilyticus]GGJ12977.1 hypothetical protein GCM10010885_22850 [Alicyclobacillus cellulosilyticus]